MNVAQRMAVGFDFRPRQKLDTFLVRREHRVEQAHGGGGRFLRHAADAPAGRFCDFAQIGMKLVEDHLQQRGFARPVAAHQPHAPPRGQRSARALYDFPARNADGDVVDNQHGGGCI